MCTKSLQLCLTATPWTTAQQAPLSVEFFMQEYWSGLPCPPPGDLPNPGIKPVSPASPALAGGFFTTSTTCLTLCNAMDHGLPGFSVHGILQTRILGGLPFPSPTWEAYVSLNLAGSSCLRVLRPARAGYLPAVLPQLPPSLWESQGPLPGPQSWANLCVPSTPASWISSSHSPVYLGTRPLGTVLRA